MKQKLCMWPLDLTGLCLPCGWDKSVSLLYMEASQLALLTLCQVCNWSQLL